MSELFDQIDSLRRTEGRAALATLVSTHGTTPRKEGAKMWERVEEVLREMRGPRQS